MEFVPAPGDIVWIDFDPRASHEQAGRHPALVLSAEAYNRRVGLALFCPITNRAKGYPFEVALPDDLGITGVLADQIKSVDWRSRKATRAGAVPASVLAQVLSRLNTLLPKLD